MLNVAQSSPELGDIPCHGPEAIKRILYIDAYDSFTRNVIDLLEDTLRVIVDVIRIDDDLSEDLQTISNRYDAIVGGPGPGNPNIAADIGHMKELWALKNIPVLGVCLGFQSLCCESGAEISRLSQPRHGRVVEFAHSATDIFRGLPGFKVTLYNSLRVRLHHPLEEREVGMDDSISRWEASPLCRDLLPLAWYAEEGSADGEMLMAVRHRIKPFWGIQFHPESCKSDDKAKILIKNWWEDVAKYNQNHRPSIDRPKVEKFDRPDWRARTGEHGVDLLLRLTQSEDKKVYYRVCHQGRLNAAEIGETVGIPHEPGVILEVNSRYSIISVPGPGSWTLECILGDNTLRAAFSWRKKGFEQRLGGGAETFHDCIRHVLNSRRAEGGDPDIPFWGGFLGYLSYEMGVQQFGIPAPSYVDGEKTSDAHLIWVDRSIVIDRDKGKVYVQSLRASDNDSGDWLDAMRKRLEEATRTKRHAHSIFEEIMVTSGDRNIINRRDFLTPHLETEMLDKAMKDANITPPDERAYKRDIEACQEYISRGDSYELCLTGETKVRLPKCHDAEHARRRSWLLYKRLQSYNPAAYSGYTRIGSAKIISSSPELFMRWNREAIFEMKPMKGTVKKAPDMTLEKATEILDTPKEMGENLMIADLIRHDLFSQCGSGNVEVVNAMTVEDHTLVYQLTTHVKGYPRFLPPVLQERGFEKPKMHSGHDHHALARCMPPGSMTGAPKKRSCEILDRIEKRKRGIYSGVMGFFDVGGGGSFSVMIRSAFSWSDGRDGEEIWRIGAGGAITALSTTQGEWDEMMTKLNTVLAIFRPEGKLAGGQSESSSSNISTPPSGILSSESDCSSDNDAYRLSKNGPYGNGNPDCVSTSNSTANKIALDREVVSFSSDEI